MYFTLTHIHPVLLLMCVVFLPWQAWYPGTNSAQTRSDKAFRCREGSNCYQGKAISYQATLYSGQGSREMLDNAFRLLARKPANEVSP